MKSLDAEPPDIGKAVDDLTEALADKDHEARQAAAESLRKIAGRAAETTTELQHVKEDLARTKRVLAEVIAEKAEPEKKLAERTAQLGAANKELEEFSYVVSHDLRAPLQAVRGLANVLIEDYAERLDDTATDYCRRIVSAADRMNTLIPDLVAFSRMARAEMRKMRVSMDELVKEVLTEVTRELQGREIDWMLDPLPEVWVDRLMIEQVWVNLISNAVKFTRPRECARIQIRCANHRGGEWEFAVQDNGTGFDMRYAGRLFGLFHRLHRSEDFAGTGIGLAMCKRNVERHGGRIWAESQLGQGSTFFFTLPIMDNMNS